ncbi:restriction endonuclease subunit S [Ochrobactrum sp. A-1]|uniref:restriction endonuclease subunit S n=1 Tax=Ochrobactrum sp. A-1 TaxID=2920940 RepID=UPI001F0AF5E8|nr:restriction endonuclease subunit S [Ochrobactrum sp. A-1]
MSLEMVSLGDVGEFIRGITYKPTDVLTGAEANAIPCLRTKNIQEFLEDDDLVYVPRELAQSEKNVRAGDILVSSANSWNLVAKCCWVPDLPYQATFGGFTSILRTINKKIDARYLYRWFSSPRVQATARSFGQQTTNISNLNHKRCLDLEIPLPPLDEQKRIAAILDKADQLRQKRRQAIALLDSLTQSIFLEMFGDPVSNPKGLKKKPLGELIKVSSGDGLTSVQMDTAGIYSVYGGNGINGRHSAYMFDNPQIAIGRVGVYCGAVHVTKPKSWITDNALYVSKNMAGLRLRYLAEALRMANLNQYAGRAAQPLISGSRIYPVEILIPAAERQLAFENMLLAAEENHRQIYKSQEHIDAAFSSLQHRAFSGQL